MGESSLEFSRLVDELRSLSVKLAEAGDVAQWRQVEISAQALANALRVKNGPVDNHTILGKTTLPATLNHFMKLVVASSPESLDDAQTLAAYELLRVGANLCMDHDGNREQLLDSGFLHSVVSLLERYSESIPKEDVVSPLPLSIPHLKVAKTSIGVLLNATINYEPVRSRLVSLEVPATILRLSAAVYPPGRWYSGSSSLPDGKDSTNSVLAETWALRSGLSAWVWRAISELKLDDTAARESDDNASTGARPLFGPDIVPLLVQPLKAFIPPYPVPTGVFTDPTARRGLAAADLDVLEEVCMLIESLCLDVEDVRLSLARGLSFPDGEHGGVRCLQDILTFIDRGDYPPVWASEPLAERQRRQKAFDICKAALIKAVVEVAGEEKNTDVLWDESEDEKPGGEFVSQMVTWIRTHKTLKETHRDDLVICATLCLGNLVRREAHSNAVVNPPIALAPDLVAVLEPDTDIKVKHGVIGLLKHLAQSAHNRVPLGQAGVITKLAQSQVWAEAVDMAELVQVSAIGISKHLCSSNVENVFHLTLPMNDEDQSPTALDQILALTRRSDSIAVKSEGTRVIVNAIKSVWSSDTAVGEKRRKAMLALLTPQCASALAQLLGRSKKYPVLVNEGVVALTLLSTHSVGGPLVLDAIMDPLPRDATPRTPSLPPSASATSTSSEASPIVSAPRALDTLIAVLQDRETRFQPEVRANVCALLGQLGRRSTAGEDRAAEMERMKNQARELLEAAAENAQAQTRAAEQQNAKGMAILASSAKRALEAWG